MRLIAKFAPNFSSRWLTASLVVDKAIVSYVYSASAGLFAFRKNQKVQSRRDVLARSRRADGLEFAAAK
jgi:hypothetical protein